MQAGRFDEAAAEWRSALDADPTNIMVRQRIAEAMAKTGDVDGAIREYQQVAGAYAANGLLLKAIAVSKVILRLNPNHTETQRAIGQLYSKASFISAEDEAEATDPNHDAEQHLYGSLPPSMASELSQPGAAPISEEGSVVDDAGWGLVTDSLEVDPATLGPDRPTSALPAGSAEGEPQQVRLQNLVPTPLFSELDAETFVALVSGLTMRTVAPGDDVVTEGDMGDRMYIVVQGTVEVYRNADGDTPERSIAEMTEGAFFGEMSLVAASPRLASVRAQNDVVVLELSAAILAALNVEHPSLGDAVMRFYRNRLLANVLRSSPLFQKLAPQQKQRLSSCFRPMSLPAHTVVLEEGQPGQGLYVILRGTLEASGQNKDGERVVYPHMTEGDVFGEIGLLTGNPSSATVQTLTTSTVLALSADDFHTHVMAADADVRRMITELANERMRRSVVARAWDLRPS